MENKWMEEVYEELVKHAEINKEAESMKELMGRIGEHVNISGEDDCGV